ncbi:MAG: UDP-N-acetylmuramate:L-alanyl-gamma-D-glutamyl-meso-diaminopimelate ligase [Acidobacteriaceae bacterium]
MKREAQHVHLIGICGTAMASLAGMLQLQGHRVTGSDAAAYPPMSDFLRTLGIPVQEPYAEKNLDPRPDLVIVGNAISRGNVELEAVLDARIPLRSMAQTIHEEFIVSRETLVVAGTHGKTTTTSMLAWIYETAARLKGESGPSFLVGGVAENFGASFQLKSSRTFILEGDEYDTAFFDKGPKFMHYFPDAAILTHVEFDHADIYLDLDAVKTAFKRFVNLVPRRGRIVAFDGSDNVSECIERAFCKVERYGLQSGSEWQMVDLSHAHGRTRWQVLRAGRPWLTLDLPMAGEHNALNATAAAALAAGQGIEPDAIAAAIASFQSVKRRLEVRAVVDGVTVIDDFAHHPTAIRETLKALRAAYPKARLWAVLEPRSNTLRRSVFQHELVEALTLADRVVIAGVFKQESIPAAERLHPEAIVSELIDRKHPAQLCADADAIVDAVAPEARPGDVIAILSNGGFGGIYDKLPARLQSLAKA